MQKNKIRVLLYRRDCGYCKMYLRIIAQTNLQLLPENRISSYDVTDVEDRGFYDPFVASLNYDGVPTLFFDGIKIVGANSKEYVKEQIYRLVKSELVS